MVGESPVLKWCPNTGIQLPYELEVPPYTDEAGLQDHHHKGQSLHSGRFARCSQHHAVVVWLLHAVRLQKAGLLLPVQTPPSVLSWVQLVLPSQVSEICSPAQEMISCHEV